jgi:hypothetical protein
METISINRLFKRLCDAVGKGECTHMLEGLKNWRNGGGDAAEAARVGLAQFDEEDDRRRADRVPMPNAEVYLFLDEEQRFVLRLRDLCSIGVSGLTDAPLTTGDNLIIQLEEMLMPAATVVWTRRALIGLHFVNPLPLARFRHICERQEARAPWSPAMRANSDLHSWWTDVDEQKKKRTPRLRAGGHKHPVAR